MIDSIVWAFRHTERNIADTGEPLCLCRLARLRNCVYRRTRRLSCRFVLVGVVRHVCLAMLAMHLRPKHYSLRL